MNRAFSVYLDLVRFLAACLVYLYHSNQRWLIADVLPLSNYGHSAVIIFFVLSGFVIAWVTGRKENEWHLYASSRLARVFSVVVPALVLCVVLDAVGRQIWGKPYASYPFDQLAVRLGASLLMLNEVWFVSITSLSNVPYWSITYEFWYYVLFGVLTFVRGRLRWWLAAGLLLLLGPKVALLAPIWLSGVLLHRWQALQRIPIGWAWGMVVVSTVLIFGLHGIGFFEATSQQFEVWIGAHWYRELTFSKFFLGDYLLGLLVFCQFAGMRCVAPSIAPALLAIAVPVKWLAGYTFTLYLLHHPLFLFWGAVWRGDPRQAWAWWVVTGLTALSVLAIGEVTEHRREPLRRWVQRLLGRLRGRTEGADGQHA